MVEPKEFCAQANLASVRIHATKSSLLRKAQSSVLTPDPNDPLASYPMPRGIAVHGRDHGSGSVAAADRFEH